MLSEEFLESSERLPVQLIRVNRQIHNEAASIAYTHNAFIFHDAEHPGSLRQVLQTFATSVSLGQRRLIRNAVLVGLDAESLTAFLPGDSVNFGLPIVLPGLHRLWVDILEPGHFLSHRVRGTTIEDIWKSLHNVLRCLMGSRLIGVGASVVIEDCSDLDWTLLEWEAFEKRVAQEVEKVLLFRIPQRPPIFRIIARGNELI